MTETEHNSSIRADPNLQDHPQSTRLPLRRTLLLLAVYPAPELVRTFHENLNKHLLARFSDLGMEAGHFLQLYEPCHLHVTVATLCRHPLSESSDSLKGNDNQNMKQAAACWAQQPLFESMQGQSTTLKLSHDSAALFDDGIGVLLWDDTGKSVVCEWREALRQVCVDIDSQYQNKFFTPTIIHSTVLRWKRSPPVNVTVDAARDAYKKAVGDAWSSTNSDHIEVPVRELRLVEELAPCMAQTSCYRVIQL